MKEFTHILIVNLLLLIANSFAQSLGALIPDFRVNDDLTNYTQEGPNIGVDGQGNFIIVWGDRRNTPIGLPVQVYCQRFSFDGTRLGVNFRIGQDTAGGGPIAVLSDGRFIVSWGATVNGKRDVYCQRFFSNGTPNGVILKATDTTTTVLTPSLGDIGADSIGNFIIVWTDYRNGTLNPDVYGQRFDSSGTRIGNNFRINDNTNNTEQLVPKVAANKDGSFVICWLDYRNTANGDIYMQRYDRFGNIIGNNQRVDDDIDNSGQGGCDVSSDGRGYFVVAFDDYRDVYNRPHIYYQVYDSLGNKIGVNRKADENTGQVLSVAPRIGMQSNGKFVITWSDDRYNNNVPFAQRFNKEGTKIGVNFRIPEFNNTPNYGFVVVSLFSDRIYSSWNDTRNGNPDIYANVKSFINPDSILSIIGIEIEIITQFKLYPAFPNPFNPIAKIRYYLPKDVQVTIKIYDLLGREVITLVNELKKAGYYEAVFDGTNYASGVYFYRIEARQDGSLTNTFVHTKKMVLVK